MNDLDELMKDPRSRYIVTRIIELMSEEKPVSMESPDDQKRMLFIYIKFLERIGEMTSSGELGRLGYKPIVDRQGNKILREEDLGELLVNFYRGL
ncbi:hypothetical protein H6763_04095 [Candidatus Nomurabacteria bacterium]|uniref:Uncharacterized protein n=1 Tax=Candidatus Dojkabacteria bacterium TaxID=2099670 RepID=A0A955KXG5_9BACT|nr:hypothetical protein [Candidatus Dojkabacteria bacterium]MCB9789576.1 hypothetical protein [Candidatus Nomurabacteria bacterium]MCB9803981.1 hypothetical protein [Candidatus Nomurabacteria bacterium]